MFVLIASAAYSIEWDAVAEADAAVVAAVGDDGAAVVVGEIVAVGDAVSVHNELMTLKSCF